MRRAVKYEIFVRYDEDPIHDESLQEHVEELIENYRQKRLSDEERPEEPRDALDEIRSESRWRAKGPDDSTELSFDHAIEAVHREGTTRPKRHWSTALPTSSARSRDRSISSSGRRKLTSNRSEYQDCDWKARETDE